MIANTDHPESERAIQFLSDGLVIRGVLRVPKGSQPHPIVILGHGLGALKEWTLPDLGLALGEIGIASLWFDYRNFGDSEGQPRNEVSHFGRLEDWQNAISFAQSLDEIDSSRIGIWGTSLGGRDVLAIASFDRRIKAVVSQTPLIQWTTLTGSRMAGYGDDLELFQRELSEDRMKRAMGEKAQYIPFVKPAGDDVKAGFIASLSEKELRNYNGLLTLQTYQPNVLTDVRSMVGLITPTPLLFILAEEDFLPGQYEAFDLAQEPKSLVKVHGNHFSPYTTSKQESIAATTKWFKEQFESTTD